MKTKKTIWFALTNVPHVNFLLPIIRKYEQEFNMVFTVRDFAETISLFEKRIAKPYILVGDHKGGNKLKKVLGLLSQISNMYRNIPDFDIKISVGGMSSSPVAWSKGKLSITFDDNETSPNWMYAPFTHLALWPKVIDKRSLNKQFFKNNLYQYNGYKEDFYLADYHPDSSFLDKLPFKNYVVVRPENIKASYVQGRQSIVPELLKELDKQGYNILFLPRYESDRDYADGIKNIYIPNEAVNGLDACYYADAILTGAGTMAREAACLGVPSVSFFAGVNLLTVDQSLVQQGKMFFSRDVQSIMNYLEKAKDSFFSERNGGLEGLERCKQVQKEILEVIDKKIKEYLKR
jgi:predicted glycosyltransferase